MRKSGVTSTALRIAWPVKASAEERFSELYREQRDAAWAYALSITGDAAAAEDVVASVFERLYRRRARIRYDAGAKPLLFRAVRNAAIDELRRRRRQALPTAELPETAAAAGPDPEAISETLRVRRALAGLAPEERELVVLRYWADLSNAQIGKLVGISASNVGTRLHRLLGRLRAELERDEAAPSDVEGADDER
jgi:RNA polymerase sigma-70 factor (ECF subfamily)